MDDVGKLVLFRDVVRLGGFTKAARAHNLSHSTVSKHVRTLEERLGVQLLVRTSRSMRLTDDGEVVYAHGMRIGAAVQDLEDALEARRGVVSGALKVTSVLHVAKHIVQPAVAALLETHPGVRVTLELSDGPLAFHAGGYDVAVRVGLPREESLTARKLLENHVCFVASPALLARAGALSHPSELATYPTLAYRAGTHDIRTWSYIEKGAVQSVRIHPVYTLNDGNALRDAALAGMGVAYLSAFAAQDDVKAGRLVRVLPAFALPPYDPVYMLTGERGLELPKMAALRDALVQSAARYLSAGFPAG